MIRQYDQCTLKKLQDTELSMLGDIINVCEKYNIGYFAVFGTLIGAIRHNGFIPWDDDMDIAMLREDYDKFCQIFEKEMGHKYSLMTPLTHKGFASTVIKVEKKGTKFIPNHSRKMKCEQGIFIDIFIYDKVSKNPKQYKRQIKRARFLAEAIFLAGSPYPEINIGGIKEKAAKFICMAVHYMFKLVPGIHVFLYKKFIKYSVMANNENVNKYTIYQSTAPNKCVVDIDNILPYQKVRFGELMINVPKDYDYILRERYGDYMKLPPEEERINHAADIIDFGNE
ncbi:MAG: phosphorylcholine transferase LicD [Lachnospiraceae bacterium]